MKSAIFGVHETLIFKFLSCFWTLKLPFLFGGLEPDGLVLKCRGFPFNFPPQGPWVQIPELPIQTANTGLSEFSQGEFPEACFRSPDKMQAGVVVYQPVFIGFHSTKHGRVKWPSFTMEPDGCHVSGLKFRFPSKRNVQKSQLGQ